MFVYQWFKAPASHAFVWVSVIFFIGVYEFLKAEK